MRKILSGLCLSILLLMVGDAQGADLSPSESLRTSIDHILMVLKEPAYRNPATREPLREKIERDVEEIFNFQEFSKRTLGSYWNSFSSDQQARFAKSFSKLLLTTYLDKVDGYNGEKIVYLGERMGQNNKIAEVQTQITFSDGKAVLVAYRLALTNDKWRIYDLLVENVGLNSNYRAQFRDILSKSSPDELIKKINERVEELKKTS